MASHPKAHPPLTKRAHLVSPLVDFALVGGASLAVFAFYRSRGGLLADRGLIVAGLVPVLLNWPHFAATVSRLYGSRSSFWQYPITAIAAPLVAGTGVVASLLSPLLIAPVFLKTFLIWSPFHYSGQTLGVGMLYARRASFRVDRVTRAALAAFIYLTFVSQSAFSEVGPTGIVYFGVRLPTFGLAPAVPWMLRNVMYACGAVALISLTIATFKQRRLPPVGLLLAPLAQYVWFVPGAEIPGFRELVPAFHSLQYLVVAGAMHVATAAPAAPSGGTLRIARWMALNVAGGAVLFALLPRVPRPFGYPDPLLAAGVVTAGVQIHHFFVDGVIWKLRKRAVAIPLGAAAQALPDSTASIAQVAA